VLLDVNVKPNRNPLAFPMVTLSLNAPPVWQPDHNFHHGCAV